MKGWFSDLEIQEVYQQINRGKYQQDITTRTKTLNTEKEVPPNRSERQNNENLNATPPAP